METSVRLILLCIGFVIIAGIFWDISRNKKKTRKPIKTVKSKTNSVSKDNEALDLDHNIVHDEELLLDDESLIAMDEDRTNIIIDEMLLETPQGNQINTVAPTTPVSPISATSNPASTESKLNSKKDMTEIMAIMVMARQPGCFLGKRLLEAFQEVHLHFGARQIFHRYENQDGTGHKVFSVTSAVEPGVFNLSKMDTFTTPGILLFFPLNHPNQSIAAFEQMLRTAKLLGMRLDGELKDERRRPLTNHMIEQCREKVRNLSFA